MVEILESGGVRAAVIDDWTDFSNRTVEKLLWSSIFWLLSAALGGKPVRTALCFTKGLPIRETRSGFASWYLIRGEDGRVASVGLLCTCGNRRTVYPLEWSPFVRDITSQPQKIETVRLPTNLKRFEWSF